MRKITQAIANAFKNGKNYKLDNSRVESDERKTTLFLFDNKIAQLDKNCGQLLIRDAGRKTKTTKERLNGLLESYNCGSIYQKQKKRYYINRKGYEEKWNGFLELDIFFS